MKTFHQPWYAGETVSVGIGQGAVAATPLQMARALSGIASGGALRRPHVVSPDQIPAGEREAFLDTFPGTGDKLVPLSSSNWQIITEGMANTVNMAGGTGAAVKLEGIDFAGKTGTAQVMSHDALAKTNKGKKTQPNAWFVGLAPRRNPDIVVAVLWENGDWGKNSAKLAAQVVSACVDKQRKRAGNIRLEQVSAPVPAPTDATPKDQPAPTASAPATVVPAAAKVPAKPTASTLPPKAPAPRKDTPQPTAASPAIKPKEILPAA
jgi:penicillin-binding protein 2